VSSARIARLHGARLLRSLRRAGHRPVLLLVPDGEGAKTPAQVEGLHRRFARAGLDRGAWVLALGGGVVGDVAGFAAATYLRGVRLAMAPTTLLAQVDASIGGKTGVNLPEGKNLVGSFHQPRLVLADTRALATLPEREFRSGLAEVVKVGAALDRALFALVEREADRLLERDPVLVARVVARCARLKAGVVTADERDLSGRRAVLNYGHTVGHALEAATGYRRFRHGEAVSIGIVAAARLAVRLGALAPADAARQERLLARLGLPTRVPRGVPLSRIVQALRRDKKARDGRLVFVLTPSMGSARLRPLRTIRHVSRVLVDLGCGGEGASDGG
jgi:3-dehydroquinate synthase